MKNNIILIGYMGCGKSSVGVRLSKKQKVPFLDTDQWIEKKQGTAISEIFARKGEEAFRDMETECLKTLLGETKGSVISVGGGLPVREVNRELLKQLGHVIYLKANPETIYERIKGDTTRPLLQTSDPQGKIVEMLTSREDKYMAAAKSIVEVDGKTYMEIIQEILEITEAI